MGNDGEHKLNIPEWLDEDYMQMVLRHAHNNNTIKVNGIEISSATGKSDHFSSVIFRIQVDYLIKESNEPRVERFIIKTMPFFEGVQKEVLGELDIFVTESEMYGTVIPKITKLLKEAGIPFNIGAKCVYYSLTPHQVMVFGDMKDDGYVMNKTPLHDMRTVEMITKKIAHWHAASAYLNETEMDMSKYCNGTFSENTRIMFDMFKHGLYCVADVVAEWPGYEEYVPYIRKLAEEFQQNNKRVCTPKAGGWNVLNHGDFHLNNWMFQFTKEGRVKDVEFIDFQLCFWATPAYDLIYVLLDCQWEFMEKHEDEILRIYHEEYVHTLAKLGYAKPIPTLLDLQMKMLEAGQFWTFFTLCFQPFLYLDRIDGSLTTVMETSDSANAQRKLLFNVPEVQTIVKSAVVRAVKKGFLTK